MADVVNKTTFQYLKSVNTPDFNSADWWINPVIPGVAQKYWRNHNNVLKEMTQAQKDAVDAAEAAAAAQVAENAKDFEIVFDKTLKAFALVVLDEINALRSNAGLSQRTKAQLNSAVKTKYDTL